MADQEVFWNRWNTDARELQPLDRESLRRGRWVHDQLAKLQMGTPSIIDIGCGTGWLSDELRRYGPVVATDLAGDVIERARSRYPEVEFAAGDFQHLDFGGRTFDVAVCLETLSHVPDQRAFVEAIARLLRPGGYLLLTTQNRAVMQRLNVPPPGEGQLRRWVDKSELRQLLTPAFAVESLSFINAPGQGRLQRFGSLPTRLLPAIAERMGVGKTLVAVAHKPRG
jgi:2-polyprenyl-3-methyl-5-hydroxy-6-metoxy-1,4-benzoquinol methylase